MSKRLTIKQDEYCESPRTSCDNVWTLACWHRNYNLGDEQPKESPSEFIEELPEGTLIRPLYLYDHSGIAISLGAFSCPWDSGQVGIAYLTPKNLKEEYGDTPADFERALSCLEGEIREYDNYLRGNCWYYKVEEGVSCEYCGHEEREELDCCYGFIGDNFEDTGIADHLVDFTKEEIAAAWDKRFD
jgi:hypothetical protein